MSVESAPGHSSMIDRVKNILLTPGKEWDRIAAEPANTAGLYIGYLLPLAALSAICSIIGWTVFGFGAFGYTIRMPLMWAVTNGVVQVVMAVVGAFVLAIIIDMLAPTFGSTRSQDQAQKLAVYSSTAGLLAGVFMLFPPLAMLGILGLYSLFLLYVGLPRLMKTPEDKRIGYFVTIIIVCIVLGIVAGVIMGAVRGMSGMMTPGLPELPK